MPVLVLQSHAARVPMWIHRCTGSVRSWAETNGYAYRLLGDELFSGIPLQISLKAQSRLPAADLGRLLWIERLLAEWEQVIWIDSDVLVFDPEHFVIDLEARFLVCREILVRRQKGGAAPSVAVGSNPTCLMFQRNVPFLRRWIEAMEKHAARAPGLGDADFGREMLRRLAPSKGLPTIDTIGHFNAAILKDILGKGGPSLALMMKTSGVPFAAANLCSHYKVPNLTYTRIVDALMRDKGALVKGQLLRAAPAP